MAAATAWYQQRSPTAASNFLQALDASLAAIQDNPFLYQIVAKGIRRARLRRFPYGLMYFVDTDAIVVLTCFHDHRDPRQWRDIIR